MCSVEEIGIAIQQKEGFIIDERKTDDQNAVYSFELFIQSCEVYLNETKIRGHAKISKNRKNFFYLKIKNKEDVIVAYCHLKHCYSLVGAADVLNISVSKLDKTLLDKILRIDSKLKFEAVRNESIYSFMREPPLQWALDHSQWALFWFLHYILGASIKAKSSSQQSLTFFTTKFEQTKWQNACLYAMLKELDYYVESEEEKESLIELLLFYGNHTLPELNQTLLYAAKKDHAEALKLFISSNHSLNIQDQKDVKKSVLHHLVEHNNINCLKLLRFSEIKFNAVDKFMQTALHYAVKDNRSKCLQIMLESGAIDASILNAKDNQQQSAIELAYALKSKECAELLLQQKDIWIESTLYLLQKSVKLNWIECLKVLISRREININLNDNEEKSALLLAFQNKDRMECALLLLQDERIKIKSDIAYLHRAIKLKWIDCLKLLLKNKNVKVNGENRQGITALGCAIEDNRTECIELLLQHKDIDANFILHKYKGSCLHLAVSLNSSKSLGLLLQHPGIDVNKRNQNKETALQICFQFMFLNKN